MLLHANHGLNPNSAFFSGAENDFVEMITISAMILNRCAFGKVVRIR